MAQNKFSYFIVFGTMRCGSNLFQQSLNQFDDVVCYGELFNPAFIDGPKTTDFMGLNKLDREKNPDQLIEKIVDNNAEGIAGFRFFENHDPRIMESALHDPQCAKIILQRDYLQSFVSLKIAQKTDQWMLRDEGSRKHAKIIFNPGEFENYRSKMESYYAEIQSALQTSGQTAFWISYPDQKDVDVLNGLTSFLGYPEKLKKLKEITIQQNVGEWASKIENIEEFQSHLANNPTQNHHHRSIKKTVRPNIPKMITCVSRPVLFAPIPGGPNDEIIRWMSALDQSPVDQENIFSAVNDGTILHTGHSRRTFYEWMETNQGLVSISAVRHPVVRAYSVFNDKIFATGPNCYNAIRAQLVSSYNVELPPVDMCVPEKLTDLIPNEWQQKHHRAAFHQFLKFLFKNLNGQTSIRQDGTWAEQSQFISAFNSAVPITHIIREGKMDSAFRFIENELECETPDLPMPISQYHLYPLDDIYTQQTENLTRKVYITDYVRFGFSDYYAALDA